MPALISKEIKHFESSLMTSYLYLDVHEHLTNALGAKAVI